MTDFILTNLEHVPGREITAHLGLVQGNTVRAKHIGRDIASGFKNIVGGELHAYTELLTDSRQQAVDRMTEAAKALGANAVVNIRFSTSFNLIRGRRRIGALCLRHRRHSGLNMILSLISFLWPILLLILGWGIGRMIIHRHRKRLDEQDLRLKNIRLHNVKYRPGNEAIAPAETFLVTGSLVLSIDVFRRLIASFVQLAGGEINNYSDLLERGRRDALLRLKAEAEYFGASDIYNIKIQSAAIGANQGIEILAYGTAVKS